MARSQANMPRQTVREFGTSIRFNGTTSSITWSNIGLGGQTAATISVWAKLPTNIATTSQGLFDSNPGAVGAVRIYFDGAGNVGYDIGGSASPSIVALNTLSNLFEWNLWTITISSSNITTLYLNGIQIGQVTNTNNMAESGLFYFAVFNSTFFSGLLDELLVYKGIALTPIQILNYYYTGGLPSGAYLYAKLDEGSGTIATDSSGNGNNGTINNATYSSDVFIKMRTVVT